MEFRTEKDDFVVAFYRNLREKWNNQETSLKQDTKNETSLKQVLKQVLKQSDYDRILPIIEYLDTHDEISLQVAMELTGKSRTTAWRYLQRLSDAKAIQSTGNTNNVSYMRII